MTPREEGFLLLTSQLGNPERKSLTVAQLRSLTVKVQGMEAAASDKQMQLSDLMALGCTRELAERVLQLLSEEELLEYYLQKGRQAHCQPITRVSQGYPAKVRRRLGIDSPGCLWARGDVSLLDTPKIALVGSRDLMPPNEVFAREVGRQAARQGYTLVSGNARGADRAAQETCLAEGGNVIVVVADELYRHTLRERVLYLSEDSFDAAFSAPRALSRNRVIHSLGIGTFVAQSGLHSGGTWSGTVKNLLCGWSPVFCFDDGSCAAEQLQQRGAVAVETEQLKDLALLQNAAGNLFNL
ncbi:MAG: DNA-processing protein DprA [Oscillospiraceae bacterium]|nr:DNA-processing protein DprA [Oscillospiraceae bacterium]